MMSLSCFGAVAHFANSIAASGFGLNLDTPQPHEWAIAQGPPGPAGKEATPTFPLIGESSLS
jgi:hypothetical protein